MTTGAFSRLGGTDDGAGRRDGHYLLHWQAGVLVVLVTGFALKSVAAFALSVGVVLVFALFERRFVSGPLEQLRRAVKKSRGRIPSGVSEPAGGAREPAG